MSSNQNNNSADSFGIQLGELFSSSRPAAKAAKSVQATTPKPQVAPVKRGLVKPKPLTPTRGITAAGKVIKPAGHVDLRDTLKVPAGQGTQGRVYTKAKHAPANRPSGKVDLRDTLKNVAAPAKPSQQAVPQGMRSSDKVPYGKVRIHYGVDDIHNPKLAILPMVAGKKGIHSHPHLRIPEGGFTHADLSLDAYHSTMLLIIRFNQIHDRVVLVAASEAARQYCTRDDSKARILLPNGFGPVQMPAPTASGPVEFLDVNDANDVGVMEILTPGLNGWLLDHGIDLHGIRMLTEAYNATALAAWNMREVMCDKAGVYRQSILAETRDWGAPDRLRGVTKSATGQTQKVDLWIPDGRDVIEPSVAAEITAAAVYRLVEYSNSTDLTKRQPRVGVQMHPEEAADIRSFFDKAGILCAAPKKKAGVVSGAAKRPEAKWKHTPEMAFA